jgi:hypothetical protein
MRISRVATVACTDIVMTVLAPIAAAGTASDDSVSKVWALENHYWEYMKNGDSEHYLTLWHKDFIGWACAFAAPPQRQGQCRRVGGQDRCGPRAIHGRRHSRGSAGLW